MHFDPWPVPPSLRTRFYIVLVVDTRMNATITPPTERTCELCGRAERWDDEVGSWRIEGEPGSAYCLHEWDINGTFVPIEE